MATTLVATCSSSGPIDVEHPVVLDDHEIGSDVATHHLGPVDDEGGRGVKAADVGWEQPLRLHSPLAARTL